MSLPSNRLTKFSKALLLEGAGGFWREFRERMDAIPFWSLVSDFAFVARGLWFFLLFDVLIFVFFIVLPQGKDILLVIIENTGKDFWWTLLILVLGTVFWGMVAEFGARYTMYVTDNSGDSLSDERVEWRKFLQRSFAGFSLYYPPVIIMAGLAIAAFGAYPVGEVVGRYEFFMTLGLFYLVYALLYNLYSRRKPRERRWLRLPQEEEEWVSKLYGIYKPYVFMYPADEVLRLVRPPLAANPWNPASQVNWEAEEGKTDDEEKRQVEDWPKNARGANGKPLVNGGFEFYRFSKKRDDVWARWFYRIPLNFLKALHLQLLLLVSLCVVLLVFFSMLNNATYQTIGAAGLVTFAFGCWCGVYVGLLFLDKAPLKLKLPYRMLLFIWLLVCSWYNNDHPVRIRNINATAWERPALARHFTEWFKDYHDKYYPGVSVDSAKGRVFPVLFVCAEGGACRTGAFTSMLLSKLQERYHTLNDRIYAYSSVSGGSLGVGYYNAITNFRQPADSSKDNDGSYTKLTIDFFSQDHLAAALGKLFFCEVIQLFWPSHFDGFDRAVALERSWEDGYGEGAGKGGQNLFATDYDSVFRMRKSYPAWFINTTCVETGMQCWVANVIPDELMPEDTMRDVWRHLNGTANYSTAINFSSRFPLVSPGAGVGGRDSFRRHYVDGGYFENLGAQTMADVLHALSVKDSVLFSHVLPVVLAIEYSSHEDPDPKGVRFGNEWTEILNGIYDTRDGRGSVALRGLHYLTEKELGGKVIELPLLATGKAVPLNWLLSKRSMHNVSLYCDTVVESNSRLIDLKKILDTAAH